jgi:hypothetical protein
MGEVRDNKEIEHIRALLEEGLASGICEEEPEAIIERIIAERHARHAKKDQA